MGLTSYYRKFIKGYESIAGPLILKKNAFSWEELAIEAFNKLKAAMIAVLVLALPNFLELNVMLVAWKLGQS